jgi:hypothetical protein
MPGRRRNPDDDVMVAVDSGIVVVDGREEFVRRGITRARRSHPIVKAAPSLWKPIDVHYDVEQMTAAPGERRGEP